MGMRGTECRALSKPLGSLSLAVKGKPSFPGSDPAPALTEHVSVPGTFMNFLHIQKIFWISFLLSIYSLWQSPNANSILSLFRAPGAFQGSSAPLGLLWFHPLGGEGRLGRPPSARPCFPPFLCLFLLLLLFLHEAFRLAPETVPLPFLWFPRALSETSIITQYFVCSKSWCPHSPPQPDSEVRVGRAESMAPLNLLEASTPPSTFKQLNNKVWSRRCRWEHESLPFSPPFSGVPGCLPTPTTSSLDSENRSFMGTGAPMR